jgi:NADH dehydrogenase
MTEIKIMLISAEDSILSEIDEELGKYALEKLKDNGVEIITNTHANGASGNSLRLDNGESILCHTIVWTAGVTLDPLIKNLPCSHDKSGRIKTNSFMEVEEYDGVYAVGDCASVPNPSTGKPYPPTAQHAIREGRAVAKNIFAAIRQDTNETGWLRKGAKKEKLKYKTIGVMANIGNKNGVAIIFGIKLHGFVAWFLWRTFYLPNVPTVKKKLKVMSDWTMDLIFKPDVAMIKRYSGDSSNEINKTGSK